jgi:hypothetical protein
LQPLLPNQPVCITTWISNIQGRKIWVEAVVSDKPLLLRHHTDAKNTTTGSNGQGVGSASNGTPTAAGEDRFSRPVGEDGTTYFATSQALFIVPRADGASSARLAEASKGRADTLDAAVPVKRAKVEQ